MVDYDNLDAVLNLHNASTNGDEVLCSCPLGQMGIGHRNGDEHPSCRINVEKEVFFCHGCGARGTLASLVTQVLGITYQDAVRALHPLLTEAELDRIAKSHEYVPFSRPKTIDAEVDVWASMKTPYWAERGLVEATVGYFRLGYDPEENRAVVPVYMDRRLVGYTKRRLGEEGPKWKNSKGWEKSKVLFGLDEENRGSCVLVEAPLSAIRLWQDGVRGAVASFGCSLSERQAVLIRSKFDSLTVFYDPDDAGREGTRRVIDLLSPFMPVNVVQGHRDDPAAMTKDENLAAIDGAKPSFLIGVKNEAKGYGKARAHGGLRPYELPGYRKGTGKAYDPLRRDWLQPGRAF